MGPQTRARHILQDLFFIAISIGVAIALVQTGAIEQLLLAIEGIGFVSSFIAGLLFTSVFTTAPAIVALGEIMRVSPLIPTALLGAVGAVIGDLIIFRFIRDRFAAHVLELLHHPTRGKRMSALMRLRLFRWLSFFIGGVIIASPLPDELGLGLLAFSKLKARWLIPLSFVFNFIGILLIGIAARAI